ncbi:hypothetical protein A3770_05p39370 [Chloropicon primus]|uniref:Protein NEOXANTHIN-DEFICIENT 1 n=1 Tax=Chloropicon primus TaxID=1764295 RepID=A0A5B8MLU9_9CHLO|nr:hypothetical protein A3770_05p39370 [Chloropicon primus]|eukprot:QDZ21419.1 hypothetical protein A3770_05p39370 [Chloropicon primus]
MGWDALAVVVQEMPLVELNGYTLGGFYYANYEDSPAGPMDELVVLSGLVWNAPTSCAWASHVLLDLKKDLIQCPAWFQPGSIALAATEGVAALAAKSRVGQTNFVHGGKHWRWRGCCPSRYRRGALPYCIWGRTKLRTGDVPSLMVVRFLGFYHSCALSAAQWRCSSESMLRTSWRCCIHRRRRISLVWSSSPKTF